MRAGGPSSRPARASRAVAHLDAVCTCTAQKSSLAERARQVHLRSRAETVARATAPLRARQPPGRGAAKRAATAPVGDTLGASRRRLLGRESVLAGRRRAREALARVVMSLSRRPCAVEADMQAAVGARKGREGWRTLWR